MGTGTEDQVRMEMEFAFLGRNFLRFPCLNTQQPDSVITCTVEIRIRKQDQSRGVMVQLEKSLIVPSASAQAVSYYYSHFRCTISCFCRFSLRNVRM